MTEPLTENTFVDIEGFVYVNVTSRRVYKEWKHLYRVICGTYPKYQINFKRILPGEIRITVSNGGDTIVHIPINQCVIL